MRLPALLRPSLALASCLAVMSIPGCSCAQHSAAATAEAKKIAALKDLRDSGVLSEQEYQQKAAALTGRPAPSSGSTARAVPASMGKGAMTPTVPHQLVDQGWGLSWGTITLPAGWGFNGGVIHAGLNGCVASGDSPMWTAESPDKQMGITVLPTLKTNWTTDPQMMRSMQQGKCPMVQAKSAAEYLIRYILPHLHPSFQVVGVSDEPMFAQALAQMQQMNAQMDQGAVNSQWMQSRHLADSARVLVSYQDGGHTIHEMASAVVGCSDTRMQMPSIGMPSRPTESVECMNIQGVILHLPDDGTPFTVEALRNMKPDATPPFFKLAQNPAWNQRFQQEQQRVNQQLAAQSQASLAASQATASNSMSEFEKRHAMIKDANDYRSNMINKTYGDRQAANDRVQGGQISYLSGTNTYTNPATGQQVQLSNQYNHTYMHDNGTTSLQTDSAYSPGVNWTELVPKY